MPSGLSLRLKVSGGWKSLYLPTSAWSWEAHSNKSFTVSLFRIIFRFSLCICCYFFRALLKYHLILGCIIDEYFLLLFYCGWATHNDAQVLSPGSALRNCWQCSGVHMGCWGEFRLAVCKASALPAILSLWPRIENSCLCIPLYLVFIHSIIDV